MNIAIDIDDTLTNSFDFFMPYIAEFFNIKLETLKKNNISYSNLPKELLDRELEFCKTYYDKIVIDTPFKKDAIDVVSTLHNEGHKIFIITARTTKMYTNPMATTKAELDKNNIAYDKIICSANKSVSCAENNIDLFIDDSVSNCESVQALNIKSILFTSPANKNYNAEIERIDNWNYLYKKIQWIKQGYPDREEAERLLLEAEKLNVGKWTNHSKNVAFCAEKIASQCGLKRDKAYVLGLLHDIGRRFGTKHLGHIYDGYKYMKYLGYNAVSKICLTHSFPTKDISIYLGNFDIEDSQQKEIELELLKVEFDDYDRLIQLCDGIGSADGVVDLELRMTDIKNRYGKYSSKQWNKNLELKKYFENKCKKDIYKVCKK